MMPGATALPELLERLYGAAGDADGWRQIRQTWQHALAGASAAEARALRKTLAPHLRHALRLHRRLRSAADLASRSQTLVADSARVVLFVDRDGRVSFINEAARQLLQAGDGLYLADGILRTLAPATTARLHRLVAEVAEGRQLPCVMGIPRPSSRSMLGIVMTHLGEGPSLLTTAVRNAVMVTVIDPNAGIAVAPAIVAAALALTPAEARLTALLMNGLTTAQAADRLNLRLETVRSRLKAIFEKTGTRRQASLVRLALRAIPRL